MSDQADGLRQLVRARSGTTVPPASDSSGLLLPEKARVLPHSGGRDAIQREQPGFFAAIAARWTLRRLAR